MEVEVCPQCKSDNITWHSRPKYLLRVCLFILIILFCCLIVKTLAVEDEGGLPAFMGLFVVVIAAPISVVMLVIDMLKVIATKGAHDKCGHCKNTFQTALKIHRTEAELLNMVKKSPAKNPA